MAILNGATPRARDNPFAVDRVLKIRYRFEEDSIDTLLGRLKSLHWRGAIVGPEGTGKTTLVEDIADRLAGDGWQIRGARLSQEQPRFERKWLRRFLESLGPRDLIVFDGAEQLSDRAWRRFQAGSREAGGLLITSHRAGLLPTLYRSRTSLAILSEILGELVPTAPSSLYDEATRLFDVHHGNIRDVLRSLYDLWAA